MKKLLLTMFIVIASVSISYSMDFTEVFQRNIGKVVSITLKNCDSPTIYSSVGGTSLLVIDSVAEKYISPKRTKCSSIKTLTLCINQ